MQKLCIDCDKSIMDKNVWYCKETGQVILPEFYDIQICDKEELNKNIYGNGIENSLYKITVEDFSSLGRKKPCLCITDIENNNVYKVASFNNIKSAKMFVDMLKEILT